MNLRTPLSRARGHGSAKSGVSHWWWQRLTAIALVPLTLWFVVALVSLHNADYATVTTWLHSSVNAALLALFVVAGIYHGQLGLQVVIEDYVHLERLKFTLLIALKLVAVLLAAIAVLAIIRIAVTG